MANPIMVSLYELLTRPTRAQALQSVLDLFTDLGFKLTGWVSGDLGRVVAEFLADVIQQHGEIVYLVTGSGFLDWCSGNWLTMLAKSGWNIDRDGAVRTEGNVTVTVAAGAQTLNITAGWLWVRNPTTGYQYQSTNTTTIVITAGSSAYVPVKAESGGALYDADTGEITEMVTQHTGASVTNEVDWITVNGVNEQSDASLRQECRDQWALLAINPPREAYRTLAINAHDDITRAYVGEPDSFGAFTVYLAGDDGEVDSGAVAAADAVLQVRKGITATVMTQSCSEYTCALTGTIYYDENFTEADVSTRVGEAIDTYFASVAIGGDDVGGTKKIWSALIASAIKAVDGVTLPLLTSGDFTLDPEVVGVPDYSALVYTVA